MEDEKLDKIFAKVEVQGDALIRETKRSCRGTVPFDFGLCNDCNASVFRMTEFGKYDALCVTHHAKCIRSHVDKITICTNFSQKGVMSLWDMKEIAWLIEAKRTVGFKQEED